MLGDVEIKTDDESGNEKNLFFSVEDIKKKYFEFLDLSDDFE